MKRLIIILASIALLPKLSGSAEFTRHVSADNIIENHGGKVFLKARSDLSKRIERFSVQHGADPAIAPELAELIAVCEHPRVLAAIAARESNFNDRAVGGMSEIGMYQVLPQVHGHPGKTWREQTKFSERILRDLVTESRGDLRSAVRKYNGSGAAARKYASHVIGMARSI